MGDSLRLSFKVQSTLAAQRIVCAFTGSADTVKLCDSSTSFPLGVTLDTVNDTTSSIPVQTDGKAKVFFNDTATSGERIASDSSGRAVPFTAATVTAAYVGTLIGPDVALTGTIAFIHINPGYDSTG